MKLSNTALHLALVASILVSCGKKKSVNSASELGSTAETFAQNSLLSSHEGYWLVGNWKSERQSGFILRIEPESNGYQWETEYQVGSAENPLLPYPTVCATRSTGVIKVELESKSANNSQQKPETNAVPELKLRMLEQKIDFIPLQDNSDLRCLAYVKRLRAEKTRVEKSLTVVKINENSFADTLHGDIYRRF